MFVGLTLIKMSSLAFAPKGGLVLQQTIFDNVALGTLGIRTALALSTQFNAITATFLMKRIRYNGMIDSTTNGEGPFFIGVAQGNATVGEITNAMNEANTAGPDDVTQSLTQDNSWVVLQNSVRPFKQTDGADNWYVNEEVSLGKGIPFAEGSGWQVFIYNADADALTTGGNVKGMAHHWGVWLRD